MDASGSRENLRLLRNGEVFSAHELQDDRAADCFLEMCHALSDKINAKLLRQSMHKRFNEPADIVKAASGSGAAEATDE